MMAKPMKTLELHYPMTQFLIISYTRSEERSLQRSSWRFKNDFDCIIYCVGYLFYSSLKWSCWFGLVLFWFRFFFGFALFGFVLLGFVFFGFVLVGFVLIGFAVVGFVWFRFANYSKHISPTFSYFLINNALSIHWRDLIEQIKKSVIYSLS